MRVVESADWRDSLPFETPVLVSEIAPGDDARCAGCRHDVAPHPRTELWAVKHRHPNDHGGFVRFYCIEHKPAPAPVAPVGVPAGRGSVARRSVPTEKRPPVRRSTHDDKMRAMCPNCFIEVSATGECGVCGAVA
jgi:hypothetical protein